VHLPKRGGVAIAQLRTRTFALGAVLSYALTAAGCDAGSDAHSGVASAAAMDSIVKVSRRSFSSAVAAVGAVKAQVGAEVRVGARISGRVDRLHANIKDQVRKGQVIAELDRAELESAVAHRSADVQLAAAKLAAHENLFPSELEQAKAEVDRWAATTTLTARDLERHELLLRDKMTSQSLIDASREKLTVAASQRDAARSAFEAMKERYKTDRRQFRAALDSAKALLAIAQVQVSYATIVAPIGGVIGSVSTQEGETVSAGLNAPTFVTIIDLSRLMVEAYVDEVDIGKIQLQQQASFTVDAFPSVYFEGQVVAIYPKATIQDNVVKYIVALEIATAYHGRLRPEMTATVAIQLQPRNVLAIPARAVRRENGGNFVHVSIAGRPERREVKLGWKDGAWTEITAGLEEGEEIFVTLPTTVE
jgi:macrolide-specific efflux system membrane fusion protein